MSDWRLFFLSFFFMGAANHVSFMDTLDRFYEEKESQAMHESSKETDDERYAAWFLFLS